MVYRVHLQHLELDRLSLFHRVARILDVGDAELRHRDKALNVAPQIHHHALVHEAQHPAPQLGAHGIRLADAQPRIFLRLLQAQRDPLVLGVHVQDQHFDFVALLHDFGGMLHPLGPRHVGDVNQALDPRLKLDERAVVRDRDDLALHARAHRVLRGHVLPGVRLQLLQAEADTLALPVDVEDLDLDLLPDVHHLGRVRHAAIAHVRDVEQSVHAAQIDEGAEVGDVLDDALPHLTDLQLFHEDVALGLTLGFEQHATAHHDVAASLVQLDDLELEALTQELVDVGHAQQGDLAAREERVHPHQVHHHSAFDLLDQRARHRLVLLVGFADPLPDPHEVGLLLREDDRAFLILEMLEEHLDHVPFFERARVLDLVDWHGAFRFEADVEDDGGVGHAQYLRFDDLAFFDVGERPLVQLRHLRDFVRQILFVQVGADAEGGGSGSGSGSFGLRLGRGFRIYQHSGHRVGCGFGPMGPGTIPGLRNTSSQT